MLGGTLTTHVTPFRQGGIDEKEFGAFADWVVAEGAEGMRGGREIPRMNFAKTKPRRWHGTVFPQCRQRKINQIQTPPG